MDDNDDVFSRAEMPNVIWSDPDNPWIVDRKKFREPNGYELVEWSSMVATLTLNASILMTMMSVGASVTMMKPISESTNDLTERLTAFWKNLEKDNNDSPSPESGAETGN